MTEVANQVITVKLNSWGPSIWILGPDPKKPKMYLTCIAPGPRSVDFSSLSPADQHHLTKAVMLDHLQCSCSADELNTWFMEARGQEVAMGTSPEKENQQKLEKYKRLRDESIRRSQTSNVRLEERLQHTLKTKTVDELIKEFSKENDPQVLRMYKKIEESEDFGKPREVVLEAIVARINEAHISILKSISDTTVVAKDRDPKTNTFSPKTRSYSVIESEQEFVTFDMTSIAASTKED